MENKPKVLTDRYEVGRLLGQGHFAKVYYGRSVQTNQSVAIKMIDKDKVKKLGNSNRIKKEINQIKREISAMSIVKHPNVVELYEVMATKSRIFLVLEYCKGGELFDKIAKGRVSEDVAWKYFHQLINAVDFCHSLGVYHRDIKPENLLLDDNDNLKVADFGLSALEDCKHQDGLLHTGCGTRPYVCPEIINHRGYDGTKSDIWSCGVVLFVLLAGYLPFRDSNVMDLYRKIEKAQYKCPNWFSTEAKRLLSKILDPKQETRITIPRIKESSWFRKGLHFKLKNIEKQARESSFLEAESHEPPKLKSWNAFDIIASSPVFDLARRFGDVCSKQECRFASKKHASEIISKLEEVAKRLKLKIRKKDAGLFKLERSKEGRRGILSMNAEIFQVTQTFHVVEMKKCNGDAMEYHKLVEEGLRPALAEIVWVWEEEKIDQEPL